jgi:hypothetical protein
MSDFDHFVGTRPVSEKHAFDMDALSRWLSAHLDGFQGPIDRGDVQGWTVQPHLQADHAGAAM